MGIAQKVLSLPLERRAIAEDFVAATCFHIL